MRDVKETRESRNAKVLVIGLDGATFDLIRPWAEQGELPTLKRLMDNGVSAELKSTILPITGPAWTSFMTGKNPGKHGLFDFRMRQSGSYEMVPLTASDRDGDAIWTILSNTGKNVGIINVPMTYPPEKVNGFMVTGFLTPEGSNFTYPESLLKKIKDEIKGYKIHATPFMKNKEDKYIGEINHIAEELGSATLFLMKKYKWDFFMVVFQTTDWVQHHFWKYMDEKHPEHDPEVSKKYGDTILQHYQKIDNIIKKILENIDDDTTVIIMSDHGFGPLYKSVYINNWLEKKGFLKYKKNIKYFCFKVGLTPAYVFKLLGKFGLTKLYKGVSRKTKIKVMHSFFSFSDIDWSKTKAYSAGYLGQIFINLKGREPEGIVEPGEEYENVGDLIIEKLYEFRDPKTNEKIVGEVFKKEDVYSGKYLDRAPDLLLIMTKYTQSDIEFGSSSMIGPSPVYKTGSHRMNGTLIMKGPSIQRDIEIQNAEIVDLAPTILHLMDVPIPDDMDGKVLKGVFKGGALEKNPIKYQEVVGEEGVVESKRGDSLSEREEEEVKERLRGLGYMA